MYTTVSISWLKFIQWRRLIHMIIHIENWNFVFLGCWRCHLIAIEDKQHSPKIGYSFSSFSLMLSSGKRICYNMYLYISICHSLTIGKQPRMFWLWIWQSFAGFRLKHARSIYPESASIGSVSHSIPPSIARGSGSNTGIVSNWRYCRHCRNLAQVPREGKPPPFWWKEADNCRRWRSGNKGVGGSCRWSQTVVAHSRLFEGGLAHKSGWCPTITIAHRVRI